VALQRTLPGNDGLNQQLVVNLAKPVYRDDLKAAYVIRSSYSQTPRPRSCNRHVELQLGRVYEYKEPKFYQKASMFMLANVGRGKPALRFVKKWERGDTATCAPRGRLLYNKGDSNLVLEGSRVTAIGKRSGERNHTRLG